MKIRIIIFFMIIFMMGVIISCSKSGNNNVKYQEKVDIIGKIDIKKAYSKNTTNENKEFTGERAVSVKWEENEYDGGNKFDVDIAAVLLNKDEYLDDVKNYIFYNNMDDYTNSIYFSGDNITGEGDGIDEEILINFEKIPSDIEKISIITSMFEAEERGENFGQISETNLTVDEKSGKSTNYNLSEKFSVDTGVIIGQFCRENNKWIFEPSDNGDGFENGIFDIFSKYGLKAIK